MSLIDSHDAHVAHVWVQWGVWWGGEGQSALGEQKKTHKSVELSIKDGIESHREEIVTSFIDIAAFYSCKWRC